MQKPSRNEPCHCGSGKKYKKCCINIDVINQVNADNDFKPNFFPKEKKSKALLAYNKVELLKILAYIQLLPQNHGKNIRIELLITEILNSRSSADDPINFNNLKIDLRRDCTKHPYEDPPEDFFTENIVFVNGNNVVYPGIFVRASDIVQSQLNAVVRQRNLPFNVVREIVEATTFLFAVHGNIAEKLGHKHRLYEQAKSDSLFLPENYEIIENKELFVFDRSGLVELCNRLDISTDVIDQFILDPSAGKINFNNPDSNPLFQRPFVQMGEKIILVLPTAELSAINFYIQDKVKSNDCVRQFVQNYSNVTQQEVELTFRHMGWTRLKKDFLKPKSSETMIVQEDLYHFDADKLAYTITATQIPGEEIKKISQFKNSNKELVNMALAGFAAIKSKYPDYKLFLVIILDRCDIFEAFFLDYSGVKNFDQYIALTTIELYALPKKWKFDNLTLWKYTSHVEEHKSNIAFMPQNTHLSKFNWYKENFDCFFHPDKEPLDFAIFDFDIEGGVNRDAKLKVDKLSVPFITEDRILHVPCRRKEKYYPVYISEEFRFGFLRNCLLKYTCPIWMQSNDSMNHTSDVYINGILYWLNEAFGELDDFFAVFGTEPITITLLMDQKFSDKEDWDLDASQDFSELKYKLIPNIRAVEIELPISILGHIMKPGNKGEMFLLSMIVKIIRRLMVELEFVPKLNDEQIEAIFDELPKSDQQKMIIVTEASDNMIVADIDIERPRFVQDADISYIMHHQVSWLGKNGKIPKKINLSADKSKLLNDLVKVHFDMVIEKIRQYNEIQLLGFLMNRHESLIQAREMRKLSYPTQSACYGHYRDVFKKFSKSESKIVTASLAVRSLIEFVLCEKPKGTQLCNDADIDLLLAHISELINYGAMSDSIKFGIDDPGMGMLPSGRIGIDTSFTDKVMEPFKHELYTEEFDSYQTSFADFFLRRTTEKAKKGDSVYFDRVDEIFMVEWGITIWDLVGACRFLCMEIFKRNKSVDILSEQEIRKLFEEQTEQKQEQTDALLELLTFVRRDGVLNTENNELHEVFPWRYNRRISYMLRPLVKIDMQGRVCYMISSRHLVMAGNNIIARFFDGTLKVEKSKRKILNLLAERNHIKGQEFRNSVVQWLKENTELMVIDHEVKIKPKGFFHADTDKGDIDILAIDGKNRVIYAIECKNTSQAKIAYDIYSEIQSYIGVNEKPGMIEKHIIRYAWLNENLQLVHDKLMLTEGYTVEAFVLTKNILPTKYIAKTKIPVYSLAELKTGGVFF